MMAEGTFQIANPYEGVLQAVAKRAGAADRGEITLAADIRALRDSGLLDHVARACLPGGDAKAGADALRQVGRASLSVGRIVEGHANALALIQLYGTPVQCGFREEWALISRDRGHAFRAMLGSHFTGSWAGLPTLSWGQA